MAYTATTIVRSYRGINRTVLQPHYSPKVVIITVNSIPRDIFRGEDRVVFGVGVTYVVLTAMLWSGITSLVSALHRILQQHLHGQPLSRLHLVPRENWIGNFQKIVQAISGANKIICICINCTFIIYNCNILATPSLAQFRFLYTDLLVHVHVLMTA